MPSNARMHQDITRREFLVRTGLAGLVFGSGLALAPTLAAMEPLQRTGQPRFQSSLAAYSFRQFFKDGKDLDPKTDAARRIDMFQFIDYCSEHQCAAETTSYYFPADVSEEYLLRLKRHAFLRGVQISGTAVGNTFTHKPGARRDAEIESVKQWIDRAALLGAPHIRVFAGNAQGTSKAEAQKLCIEALEECCAYAGRKGVVLGLENHGGIVSESGEMLEIVRAVKSPWFGVNFDSGNFHTDDPYRDLERIAPYAVNVQWKAEVSPRGKGKQAADLKRIVSILRQANYQGYLVLEYEVAEDPWIAVPRLLREMDQLTRS
jgi:sugar phosphate isomerase/epimerase